MPQSDRIQAINEGTRTERDAYLDHLGWTTNPFAGAATMDEYVMPSESAIADIATHLRDYTGPVLIHSAYSGVGKTTLLRMLLDSYSEEFTPVMLGEHNVTAYELIAILADELDIGKSSSTKLTERKVRNALADRDQPVLIGVDEFGLNDRETLHVIQFLNDLPDVRVIMTGMTSQWEAIGDLGSDGRAFQRRVSHELELDALSREQATELYQRRVASVTNYDHDEYHEVPLDPLTADALDTIHERSAGTPAVMVAALSKLVGLAAYRYAEVDDPMISADVADRIDYADPHADTNAQS
ncbi:MAG TPA: ATP-binding protein [Halococcus sp.]|nr:ATP-binding protein [Halococcus sp.]